MYLAKAVSAEGLLPFGALVFAIAEKENYEKNDSNELSFWANTSAIVIPKRCGFELVLITRYYSGDFMRTKYHRKKASFSIFSCNAVLK